MGNYFSRFLAYVAFETQLSNTFFPPAGVYNPSTDVPDLFGKVILVTGGYSGIGYETTKQLLLKNAKVYIAGRSEPKGLEAIEKLKQETGKEVFFLQLDLGDLQSVQSAAKEFLSKEERLDVLFANAGVMVPPTEQLTKDGFDQQFGTNVVGHYLLIKLLVPALMAASKLTGDRARVVHTSSGAHAMAPGSTGLLWETLRGGPARDAQVKKWGRVLAPLAPWTLYGQSKLGNVLISNILQKDYRNVMMSCALHPGGIKTECHRHEPGYQRAFFDAMFYPLPMGAYTLLWAGTSLEGEGFGGKFLYPWARMGKADKRAGNEETQDALRAWLGEELKAYL